MRTSCAAWRNTLDVYRLSCPLFARSLYACLMCVFLCGTNQVRWRVTSTPPVMRAFVQRPPTPAALRSGAAKTVKGGTARTGAGRAAAESVGEGLPCGYSEAPGWRIEMEDAVCTCVGGTENLAAAPLGVEVFPSLLWRVERPARRLHWLTLFFLFEFSGRLVDAI